MISSKILVAVYFSIITTQSLSNVATTTAITQAKLVHNNRIHLIRELHCKLTTPPPKNGPLGQAPRQIKITGILTENPQFETEQGKRFPMINPHSQSSKSSHTSSELEFLHVNRNITENFVYNHATGNCTYTIIVDLHESSTPFESSGTCLAIYTDNNN